MFKGGLVFVQFRLDANNNIIVSKKMKNCKYLGQYTHH
jgi:hypothetical protein